MLRRWTRSCPWTRTRQASLRWRAGTHALPSPVIGGSPPNPPSANLHAQRSSKRRPGHMQGRNARGASGPWAGRLKVTRNVGWVEPRPCGPPVVRSRPRRTSPAGSSAPVRRPREKSPPGPANPSRPAGSPAAGRPMAQAAPRSRLSPRIAFCHGNRSVTGNGRRQELRSAPAHHVPRPACAWPRSRKRLGLTDAGQPVPTAVQQPGSRKPDAPKAPARQRTPSNLRPGRPQPGRRDDRGVRRLWTGRRRTYSWAENLVEERSLDVRPMPPR